MSKRGHYDLKVELSSGTLVLRVLIEADDLQDFEKASPEDQRDYMLLRYVEYMSAEKPKITWEPSKLAVSKPPENP